MLKKSLIILIYSSLVFNFSCSDDPASSKDTEKPTVSILYPANNSEFDEGATITIKADATDNEEIKEVKFYIDGEIEATDDSEPYRYEWNTSGQIGSHTIKVKAYDNNDNIGESEVISIKINGVTVTDIDGNVYQTVKIGDQWWMAENLKVTRYRNGDAIPHETDNSAWTNLSTGAYCAYNNDNGNAETYGFLYNWYAVDESRNIAPMGWHVPTDEEFTALENYLIANGYNWDGSTSDDKTGKSLASKTGWNSSSEVGDVGNDMSTNNASGFTALPGGYRGYDNGTFYGIGYYGYWWSAAGYSSANAWYRRLDYSTSAFHSYNQNKHYGFSVRLIRD